MPIPVATERKPAELTPLGGQVLGVLQGSRVWTRTQIAALGRPCDPPSPDEWRVLRELATDGFIDMSQQKIGAVNHVYICKAR